MNDIQSIDALFSADLSGVDTSFPVLAPATLPCIVSSCKQDVSKEKKTPGLFITLTTAAPATTTKGAVKPAGFPIKDTIWFSTTGDNTMTLQRLAQFKEAVFGEKAGPFGDPALYVGKPVNVRIGVESSEQFGEQNRVKAFVKQSA